MRNVTSWIFACACFVPAIVANTEKAVFVAPQALYEPASQTALFDSLDLITLSPTTPSIRTSIAVTFPDHEDSRNHNLWLGLSGLTEGQRYEVRVCWPSSQPTEISVDTFNLTRFLEDDVLRASAISYAGWPTHRSKLKNLSTSKREDFSASITTAVFLRIHAVADFYTTNEVWMATPPRVNVDIILDPYLANAVPASLLATACYIVLLSIGAWNLSRIIWHALYHPKEHTE